MTSSLGLRYVGEVICNSTKLIKVLLQRNFDVVHSAQLYTHKKAVEFQSVRYTSNYATLISALILKKNLEALTVAFFVVIYCTHLYVILRVPVRVIDDDSVCSSEVDTQSPSPGTE